MSMTSVMPKRIKLFTVELSRIKIAINRMFTVPIAMLACLCVSLR